MKNIITILFFLIGIQVSLSQEARFDGSFRPERNHKYIISAWVKETHNTQQISYTNSSISLSFDSNFLENDNNSNPAHIFMTSGKIIDGWQRIIGIFTIPDEVGFDLIDIKLNNNHDQFVYFDDVRFFPYNGNLKSFVYDDDTQRLMAELDENNYATFYEYDIEGGLIRVKKETERGVVTIQETRSGNSKLSE